MQHGECFLLLASQHLSVCAPLLAAVVAKGCAYLQAVAGESNEDGQLTERLAEHAQQAPILDAWLSKFPTLRQGLPAHQPLPEVATAVDAVAKRILAGKAAAAAVKVSRCLVTSPTTLSSSSSVLLELAMLHSDHRLSQMEKVATYFTLLLLMPAGLGQMLHNFPMLLHARPTWAAVQAKTHAAEM